MGLLSYIAWPERDRLYLEKSFYKRQNIIVPQDVILKTDNQILLPTYLALYIMAVPDMDLVYNRELTLQWLCKSVKILHKVQLRKAHYDMMIDALRYLENKKYITLYQFVPKSTNRFSYTFAENLKEEILNNNDGHKCRFAFLNIVELRNLLNRMTESDKNWKVVSNALTVYAYLKLEGAVWQYKHCREKVPVWVGYMSGISKELNISANTITSIIKYLKEINFITPVYGVRNADGSKTAPTILVFRELCNGDEEKVIKECQSAIKNKGDNIKWYYPGYAPAAKKSDNDNYDETALDVVCDEDEVY
nr:MAG TPA: hypothetical protein [Caudoviricetes sp.]